MVFVVILSVVLDLSRILLPGKGRRCILSHLLIRRIGVRFLSGYLVHSIRYFSFHLRRVGVRFLSTFTFFVRVCLYPPMFVELACVPLGVWNVHGQAVEGSVPVRFDRLGVRAFSTRRSSCISSFISCMHQDSFPSSPCLEVPSWHGRVVFLSFFFRACIYFCCRYSMPILSCRSTDHLLGLDAHCTCVVAWACFFF